MFLPASSASLRGGDGVRRCKSWPSHARDEISERLPHHSPAQDMHGVALPGCYLLQVDEALDISAPARLRYQPNAASGTRKFLLTDGVAECCGLGTLVNGSCAVLASSLGPTQPPTQAHSML